MKGNEIPFSMEGGVMNRLESWGRSGPVMLCIHGMTSSRRSWERLAERFSSTHRVFSYDQRGHGDLAEVQGPMTLEQSCRDLEAAARVIDEPVDLLLGHSWGGSVALLGASRIFARSVVALDPVVRVRSGTFSTDYVEELRELFSLEGEARIRGIRSMYSDLDPTDREAKVHAMEKMSIRSIERIGSENGVDSGAWDLMGLLSEYTIPMLLIASGSDSVIAPEDLARIAKRKLPDTVQIISEAGHNLHRSHLDRVVELVREFEKTVLPV
ncbi:MAG: alpha/beta fold hydrolase [Leptospirales bacterium]